MSEDCSVMRGVAWAAAYCAFNIAGNFAALNWWSLIPKSWFAVF